MPILDQLFGTWIGILTMLTIGFIIGMGVFIFVYVRRQINK